MTHSLLTRPDRLAALRRTALLDTPVEEGFDRVYEELDQYRQGDGWVSYEKLDEADRRALSQKVDALAEPLSRVGQVLEEH